MLRQRNLRSYKNHFNKFILYKKRRKMKSRKCEICNSDVHRASYQKHLRSIKHIEIVKEKEMILPEWFFQEPFENKIKKNI